MNGERALDVSDVTVNYHGVTALRELSLGVARGEVVALIGPNGAGKTTLLNAISGLLRIAEGRIEVLGLSGSELKAHQLHAAGVGRTFQHAGIIGELSVQENVLAGDGASGFGASVAEVLRLPRGRGKVAEASARASALLEELGVGGVESKLADDLPFGSKKLVDLARALMHSPALLLLDEPTAGLTEAEVAPLVNALLERKGSMSMLVIAHHMDFVAAIADRVVCLDGGAKIADGPVVDVRTDPRVVAAYIGEVPEEEGASDAEG